ncbi:MAG: hypothetical protein JWM57_2743, partial [Phycisphaerales bacterium]|nr:hypothetical protein [Phycisphaerales bacterium]
SPVLSCPLNAFTATNFSTATMPSAPPTLPMMSYCSAYVFGLLHSATGGDSRMSAGLYNNPPTGYIPKISMIGSASEKVFVADGGKFNSTAGPSFNGAFNTSSGGAYGDVGPWSIFSRGWGRSKINGGQTVTPGYDDRNFAFRHGNPGKNSYAMNCLFFDGHVVTMRDMEACDPNLWAPRGTQLQWDTTETWKDVLAAYPNPSPATAGYYTVR